VKKNSTVTMRGNEIFRELKLIVGLDLGDRASHYCILDEAGNVILEHSLPTTPKGIHEVFSRIPRSRTTLETGTHSPWKDGLANRSKQNSPRCLARRVVLDCETTIFSEGNLNLAETGQSRSFRFRWRSQTSL